MDANGQVKKGYESRVDFILNELSEATGLELDRNKLLEEGYQSLCGEIDNLIQKKRAEATLSAMESEYTDALQKKQEAAEEYRQALELLAEVEADYEEKLAQYEDHKAGKGNLLPGQALALEPGSTRFIRPSSEFGRRSSKCWRSSGAMGYHHWTV